MTIEDRLTEILRLIGGEHNKASHPVSTAYVAGKWWVFIDVNSRYGTFDFETKSQSLDRALATALKNIRREIRS